MMTSTLHAGEPAPWFSAPTSDASADNIQFDELAGRHIVLYFLGGSAEPGVPSTLAAFARHTDLFDGNRALLVGISSDPGNSRQARMFERRPGQLCLLDRTGAIARGYGVMESNTAGARSKVHPTAFILSPALQIIRIVRLSEATAFVDHIVSLLREQLEHPPAVQNAPVLIVPQVFDRTFCQQLIDLYDAAGGREIGAVERNGEVINRFDPNFRKRLDYYISDEAALQRTRASVERRLLPMVYRAFQFPVTRIERYLVGCYDAATGGYFRPHRDNTAPVVAHRRFAVTINLNEGYEGGYLRFPEYGNQSYRAAPGDAIVFSCSLLHEVTPVTQHRRYAFLSFLYDEQSERVREANRAKADLSTRS